MDYLFAIYALLVVLFVVVVGHEFGHYLAARICRVSVEVFSFGMGPRLVGIKSNNGTDWRISAFPLGGYVRMLDDSDDIKKISQKKGGYHSASLLSKIFISVAGPIANVLLSVVLVFGVLSIYGQRVPSAVIGEVSKNGIAYAHGIKKGDKIMRIGNVKVHDFVGIKNEIQNLIHRNQDIKLQIARSSKEIFIHINAKELRKSGALGIGSTGYSVKRINTMSAAVKAILFTYNNCVHSIVSIINMCRGRTSTKDLGGVLRIAVFSSITMKEGIYDFVFFIALLSIGLGVVNMIPIPPFDGGMIVQNILYACLRPRLAYWICNALMYIGIFFVVVLMIYIYYGDVMFVRHLG